MAEEQVLKATHQGEVKIGDMSVSCAVLEDGTRILVNRSLALVLERRGGGGYWQKRKESNEPLPPEYIGGKYLEPFISQELHEKLTNPIVYINNQNVKTEGIDASVLPDICDVWIKASKSGKLTESQEKTAEKAYLLMRGIANIGITALVDEATGYQYERAAHQLEEILEAFISKELRAWVKTFPDSYYEQYYRLRGWRYDPNNVKRPGIVGKDTLDIVYKRLAPGVLQELQTLTPRNQSGNLRNHLFQRLSEDVGHPKLKEHLSAVIALMKASANWRKFNELLNRALPKYNETLPLLLDDPNDEE